MATQTTSMTTSEFATAAGVSAASISKLIRDGKLKARKEGGKWRIQQSQLGAEAVRALKAPSKAAKPKATRARPAQTPEAAAVPRAPIFPTSQAPEPAQAPAADEPAPAAPETPPEEKTYTIPEFAAMTYLTEQGVSEWLKNGRIKGTQIADGEWRILDSNLRVPSISRLLRK